MKVTVVVGLVVVMVVGLVMVITLVVTLVRRWRLRQRELEVQEYLKQNPEVLQQQQLQQQQQQPVSCVSECLTCSMIKMGSSVSYSDDTCPQCGANTTKTFIA